MRHLPTKTLSSLSLPFAVAALLGFQVATPMLPPAPAVGRPPVTAAVTRAKPPAPAPREPIAVGSASWYGDAYAGQPTASGEPFDPDALTAAHKSLPLGTMVRVTNLSNGESVVVRVNDRGPFVNGRIMDLSEAAAEQIGVRQAGVGTVKLELVPEG